MSCLVLANFSITYYNKDRETFSITGGRRKFFCGELNKAKVDLLKIWLS